MLHGKRIIVTGGTSGIGFSTVVSAARQGADVAFCGLTKAHLKDIEDVLAETGCRFHHESFDLKDLEKTRKFAQNAIDFLGGLDGLVNNAGARFRYGVNGATIDDLKSCFEVNFYPAWALCQEAYSAMKESGGGMIVNMSSIHAESTTAQTFPYNASKAALIALTKSIAVEWGRDNIRSVAIAPALIHTPLVEAYYELFDDPTAERARLENHYPIKRSGKPEDVASLVVYLLSDANQFINGCTVTVDGGLQALLESAEH